MMKAAIATGFGDINENIFVRSDWPRPTLQKDVPKNNNNPNDYMVIRVLACALAPGDARVLSGKTDYVQLPPSGHPYVIGSDVCGIVTDIGKSEEEKEETKFRVGDRVVSRFDEPQPNGGVAEYRLVKTCLSEHAPESLSAVEACTLPASAMAAKWLARNYVQPGDRVLILGGSGGVGTFLCQFVKLRQPSFLAATSTAKELVTSLGADRVIDYRDTNWWEVSEFQKDKFDVVLDLVNGDNWERGVCSGLATKPKGVYAVLLTGVKTEITVHGPIDMIPVMFQFIGRSLWSRLNPFIPVWRTPEVLALKPGDLADLFKDVDEGRIRVVLDAASPFAFTEEGVRRALALQKSIHAHGKVVIKIADEESKR